ncbi:outer membrane receptor protein involved in Fe transport [Algoriphagus aquaeductus]|uniref:Outer membrane receptor protein involved in Fe transport n=1 Tax=Algoriphagus aquaeductus TaxID=475299 RepID=A0A326S259_9BACT|nr:TonB-dependent receptor [Algoriphagus aquaeductus]PZV87148.1 outer membrane receptor protein involved in Fe transport [Algoriphagus aquaeductus]
MKIFAFFPAVILVLTVGGLFAQTPTQTLRGKISDQVTQAPMMGASVIILGSEPLLGTTTDLDGEFAITKVPVGTYSLKISFIGYRDLILPAVILNSGKETVLQLSLEENISEIQEFVVTASEKDRTINDMISVSGRTFSVEETRKFAAAVNDPGRMATSFAGVVGTDDGNNNISIRGNSPNGLLWRMEGIDIPNPNHFVNPGSSGGGISILSSQLLTNSDFITGAFAAEYGNALSGVFDLSLRKGNNQKREYTFQAGLLGTDIAMEGPFSKKYKGSYLINYRYSTLSLLSKLGVPLGDFVTNFQDLSFNFFMPTGLKSSISVFGFGGLSDQKSQAEADSLAWKEDFQRYNSTFFSNTGALGIKHSYMLGKSSFLQTTLLASGNEIGSSLDRLDERYQSQPRAREGFSNSKITLSSVLNTKLSAKASLRSGIYLNQLYYNMRESGYEEDSEEMRTKIDAQGNSQTVQAFAQLNLRTSDRLTLNMGLHYLQFLLNQSRSLEPRLGLNFQWDEKQRLSFGYGLHSQIQPLGTYFARLNQNGEENMPNKNLDLSKSHHLVLGYDRSLSPYVRLKVETYYQHLYQIPVKPGSGETYSIINQQWGFMSEPLVNTGLGKNYGVELTLEQFTYRNLYFLLSGSLYNSLYQTEEKVWRNTRFNGNANLTFTGGKEFNWRKNRVFGVNIKAIYAGGLRDTPIDLEASLDRGEAVYEQEETFEIRNPAYFRADLRFSYKVNKPRSTRIWALDIQNATNRKNVFGSYFEPLSGEIKTAYQAPLIPVLSYRVEF